MRQGEGDGLFHQRLLLLWLGHQGLADRDIQAALFQLLGEERGRAAMTATLAPVREAVRAAVAEGQAAGQIRSGDPQTIATVLLASIQGLLLAALLEPETIDREGLMQALPPMLDAMLQP